MSGFSEDMSPQAAVADVFDPSVILTPPVFDGEGEEALALRYGRKIPQKQKLIFEFTRDPALLHQYFRIYQSECRMIPEFMKAEEEYNSKSHIMVVRQGNQVVGGGRLYIVTPRTRKRMLLELAGFDLRNYFPELDKKQMTYAEISRLVVLSDYRGEEVLRDIILNMHRKCVAQGVDVLFAAAPLPNVRSYRKISKSIGIREVEVIFNIEVPPDPGFEEIKDYLFKAVIKRNEVSYENYKSSFSQEEHTLEGAL